MPVVPLWMVAAVWLFVVYIMVDGACGIRTASDTGDEVVGVVAPDLLLKLPFDLFGDHALHPGYEIGVGVRTHCRTHDVERVGRMTAPVADSLRTGITQCHVTRSYRMYLGPQHLHTFHVGVLALHMLLWLHHAVLHQSQR